jgi:hypothetical protein
MTRTIGLNDVLRYNIKKCKDIYTIVIEDSKEELAIADIFYASIQEFQEEFERISRTKKKEQVVNLLPQKIIKFVEYGVLLR